MDVLVHYYIQLKHYYQTCLSNNSTSLLEIFADKAIETSVLLCSQSQSSMQCRSCSACSRLPNPKSPVFKRNSRTTNGVIAMNRHSCRFTRCIFLCRNSFIINEWKIKYSTQDSLNRDYYSRSEELVHCTLYMCTSIKQLSVQ